MSRSKTDAAINDLIKLVVLVGVALYFLNPWFHERWYWFGAAAIAALLALTALLVWWRKRTSGALLGKLAFGSRIDELSWHEFERASAALFRARGYKASLTSASGDGGADVVLRRDGVNGIVQCKHWPNRRVGVAQVRELLGAKQDLGAAEAYFLTSGEFTEEARALATRNADLHIWDRGTLIKEANRALLRESADRLRSGEVAAKQADLARTPTDRICPECGEKLVTRDGRYGRFIGCTGFPRCRYTRDLTETERDVAN